MGKFKLGEKAPRKEAEKALRAHAAAACDHRFTVKFENDDGGSLICLYVEVEDPSAPLDAGIRDVGYPTYIHIYLFFIVTFIA